MCDKIFNLQKKYIFFCDTLIHWIFILKDKYFKDIKTLKRFNQYWDSFISLLSH